MNGCKLTLISLLILTLFSCSILPTKVEVQQDHFRFENFKRDISSDAGEDLEYVYLMCFKKKPTTWYQPRQYPSGEQNLWVKAKISRHKIPSSTKVAVVKFKVRLESGKNYMLNRKIEGDKISLWIEEVDTNISVTEVLIADLERPLLNDERLNRMQCESSSI